MGEPGDPSPAAQARFQGVKTAVTNGDGGQEAGFIKAKTCNRVVKSVSPSSERGGGDGHRRRAQVAPADIH